MWQWSQGFPEEDPHRKKADVGCHGTRVTALGLSVHLHSEHTQTAQVLSSMSAARRELPPLSLWEQTHGPRRLISFSWTAEHWVGQAHLIADVTAYLWQVLFCFNFKRLQMPICCDRRWAAFHCSSPACSWDSEVMSPNMFCKINDMPKNRVPRGMERRPTRQLTPGFQSCYHWSSGTVSLGNNAKSLNLSPLIYRMPFFF